MLRPDLFARWAVVLLAALSGACARSAPDAAGSKSAVAVASSVREEVALGSAGTAAGPSFSSHLAASAAAPSPTLVPELRVDAASLTGASLYVLDDRPAPQSKGDYVPLADGYVRLSGETATSVEFFAAFADRPQGLPARLPGPVLPSRAPALPAPNGATLALLVQRVGANQGPAVADLYTWSQRDGRRRLLATTPSLPILLEALAWANDSRWILLRVYPNDCKFQSWGGEVEVRPCERVAVVDVETGNVVYRSPAGLRPRGLDASGGKLRIMTEPVASTDDFIVGGSGVSDTGKTVWRWYELDAATRTLTPSTLPSSISPDGQFRVSRLEFFNTSIQRIPTGAAYRVNASYLPDPSHWQGDHDLQFSGFLLDLATQRASKLWPDGYAPLAVSANGATALVAKGGETHWARLSKDSSRR